MTLETINKNLLLIGFLSLIYRWGNFYNTFVPKPYEIVLLLVIILTIIDFTKNKKWKEFWNSAPKNIWVASIVIVVSTLAGWAIAIGVKGIAPTVNNVLEFGTFMVSAVSFLLVLFYTRNDEKYRKWYLYALLLPMIFVICIIFPSLAVNLGLVPGTNFAGYTLNVNIISKILLIPALYFMAGSLTENNIIWKKIAYGLLSAGTIALIVWTASRGAYLALLIGAVALIVSYAWHIKNWKKTMSATLIALCMVLFGTIIAPHSAAITFLGRVIGVHHADKVAIAVKAEPLLLGAGNDGSVSGGPNGSPIDAAQSEGAAPAVNLDVGLNETRLQIWPFYFKEIIKNPFGIGPNTHYNYHIARNGEDMNTGPHNTYLQIWLWGGLLAFISFMYVIWYVFRHLITRLRGNYNSRTLAVFGITTALAVSVAFDDSLSIYWFFIILALALKE